MNIIDTMNKITYDKNGIKVLPSQKYKPVRSCWKQKLTQEEAEAKAPLCIDDRGTYEAYQCIDDPTHWHIGHHALFEIRKVHS